MTNRPSRSVVDYDTEDELRKALMSGKSIAADDDLPSTDARSQDLDWVLPVVDHDTTEVQSMKEELYRLQVLKSYLVLDAEREAVFERFTGLASRIFNVPIALISLVDLGRQWFLSNRGLGDVRETPRKHAFCAHAILSKHNILIVPDATKDFRFKNNPLVTGPPDIRFYAGAPLVSPEGFKLGTFCIIDNKTRPAGLSQDEQANLRDLADMTVKEIVDRRQRMQSTENPTQLIAYTAHDLMTPLTGVQLSLSLLREDDAVQRRLDAHHLELLTTASNCSDLMIRICQTAVDTLRKECAPEIATQSSSNSSVTKMQELVKSLHMILETVRRSVPIVITLEANVPAVVLCDDLKLFRSALNLISFGLSRTTLGFILLKISCQNESILFECHDTGSDIPVEEYQYLFQASRSEDGQLNLGLSSVASLIGSLCGEYGFRPRGVAEDGRRIGSHQRGSIFWFSIPLNEPDKAGLADSIRGEKVSILPRTSGSASSLRSRPSGPILPIVPMLRNQSNTSISSLGSRKMSLVVKDQTQAEAVQNSCFKDVFETSLEGEGDRKMPAKLNPSVRQSAALSNAMASSGVAFANATFCDALVARKPKALVIDDSLVVRKSISMALTKLGFETMQAVNGMEGLELLKDHLFDLTLCDFLMPVMDGLDCVKQYRDWETKERSWFSQYIVGISAHATANDGDQGIKAGMDDFKPKPITIKLLSEIKESEKLKQISKTLDEFDRLHNRPAQQYGVIKDEAPASLQVDMAFADTKRKVVIDDDSHSSNESPRHLKKAKLDFDKVKQMGMSDNTVPVCLIATDTPTVQPNEILGHLEKSGWKIVVVHDGEDALRLLKMRNWDAVLLDDDIPTKYASVVVSQFREWEEKNRVNKQRNVFIVCNGDIPPPMDIRSFVHPPTGSDGVLGKPVAWADLQYFLKNTKKGGKYEIVVRK